MPSGGTVLGEAGKVLMVKDSLRILVADRRSSVRRGLAMRLALEPDLQVVGEVGDQATLFAALASLLPDAVVLDTEILESAGSELSAIQELRSAHPDLAIVLLSLHASARSRTGWLHGGADALLLKQDTGDALPRAIRQAARTRIEASRGENGAPDTWSGAPPS